MPTNKYLLKPYEDGELVQVSDNQKSSVEGQTDAFFRQRYIRIIRKDLGGKWSLNYVVDWGSLVPLTVKK